MAQVSPFKATRFNPDKTGDLNRLVTQPYDKIGKDLMAEYYERDPHNVVRIIRSDEVNQNPETPYPKAAETFRNWMNEGVLSEDPEPAFYVYYQTFSFQGKEYTRKGFVASVKLEEKGVRAHENTLAGPKADRLRLLRGIETSDELIFMLFSDPENTAVSVMDEATSWQEPLMEAQDDFHERHRLWAVRDPQAIQKLKELLGPKELFIADGHHRYETAINFKNECEAKGWKPVDDQGFDHRMMALFPMEDPGLVIFPTHRIIRNVENFSGPELLESLMKHFEVRVCTMKEGLFQKMDADCTDICIGMRAEGTKDPFYLLKLKDPSVMDRELPEFSEASRRLGVTILHKLILENELGIDKKVLEAFTHVSYARSRDKAIESVGRDGVQAAFLMNPTRVEDVRAVAAAGERMPQKSTDFYPKLLAGLVMMKLNIQK